MKTQSPHRGKGLITILMSQVCRLTWRTHKAWPGSVHRAGDLGGGGEWDLVWGWGGGAHSLGDPASPQSLH